MSQTETPEVIQGRLGWESGDLSEAHPGELEPHPKNEEIYGDTEDPEQLGEQFLESVREKGVMEPLIITEGKRIISGHRRQLAALDTGQETVPILKYDFEDELDEREALIELNRQREKKPGQILNEFQELVEIKKERGRELMSEGGKGGKEGSSNLTNLDEYDAYEEAAESFDIGTTTLKKGLKVKEKAEAEDAPEEVRETAKRELERLDTGETSFHGALKNVEKKEAEVSVKEQRQADPVERTVTQADAREFIDRFDPGAFDLLLTDPPYSTDVEDVAEFAEWWLPDALERLEPSGQAFVFIGAYPDELRAYLNTLAICEWPAEYQVLVWTYRNTLGKSPKDAYKLNWQAILYIRGEDAPPLDAPKTSERWAVHDVSAPDGRHDGRHHKWQKPDDLIDRLIRHTTTEGDRILDPFAGTGTVPIVAGEIGRRVDACDNDPEMLEIARERGCQIQGGESDGDS